MKKQMMKEERRQRVKLHLDSATHSKAKKYFGGRRDTVAPCSRLQNDFGGKFRDEIVLDSEKKRQAQAELMRSEMVTRERQVRQGVAHALTLCVGPLAVHHDGHFRRAIFLQVDQSVCGECSFDEILDSSIERVHFAKAKRVKRLEAALVIQRWWKQVRGGGGKSVFGRHSMAG